MNFPRILDSLHAADPEFADRVSPRRRAIRNMARVASLAAIPVAFGALLKRAYGKTTLVVDETLNLALRLERMERAFYNDALGSVPFPTAAARSAIETIRDHEAAHVALMEAAVRSTGANMASQDSYDFSGGNGSGSGPFAGLFQNYPLFLAVAQTLEDVGVRAYKGSVESLAGNNELSSAAVRIHSVEARHAAHIRVMRRSLTTASLNDGDVKPWLTRNLSGIQSNPGSALISLAYAGEEKSTQNGVNIAGGNGLLLEAAAEAFDEPLTAEQVLSFIDPFLA